MNVGVVLYGPPASGKDTVTEALLAIDSRFARFERMKAGPGNSRGYRMVQRADVDALRRQGDVVWSNERYGATYVIDRPQLIDQLTHSVPVVHVGQPEAITAVQDQMPGTRWIVVGLWCPRDVSVQRITARDDSDRDERLAVWDATPVLPPPATTINTAVHSAQAVARLIATAVDPQ